MKGNFTESAQNALYIATEAALQLEQNYVGTEHILLGLLSTDGVAKSVLEENHLERQTVVRLISQLIAPGSTVQLKNSGVFSPKAEKVIAQSQVEAVNLKSKEVGTEHLLIALVKQVDCVAVRLLNTIGINIQKVYMDILVGMGKDPTAAKNEYMYLRGKQRGKSETPILDQYSRDLTAYAREKKLDPVIGREKETKRLIQILSRRTKNNPCLIGEPGVGKTAIIEGLAERIVADDVPDTMKEKKIVTLDLSSMVAGSKYRGEFEERIKKVIQEVMNQKNILLFIDEIHTIIGAGGAEGAIDASNILKPALSRGEIQLIGATTIEEYRKYIEKDSALERRFQPIIVEEPGQEETIAILEGLKSRYESHHQVKITDEAITAAVKLTERYLNDRYLPDKAIDVIDEAASQVRLGLCMTSEQRQLEKQYMQLEKEKEDALIAEDFLKAQQKKKEQLKVLQKQKRIQNQKEKEQTQEILITEKDVANIIADWTKIPVQKLEEEESRKLQNLEDALQERVIGQKEAVCAVSKAIRRGRVGIKDPNRPIGSFLFLGPTGVGKTELCKVLAYIMFGKETAIIRVDMSEYMEKHSVSKLIGSPPGYVGYEQGGQLSEQVRRNPYCILLFDEIEKAHPDVFNILLQVLDDGHITDSQGRRISFKNTIIIMTSNAGAQRIISPKNLGFVSNQTEQEADKRMQAAVMEEVKNVFKPEFLNRIDEIIVFHALKKADMEKIAMLLITKLMNRMKEQMQIQLKVQPEALSFLAEKGYDPKYGARPLRRAIQNHLEDLLAEEILAGRIQEGAHVTVRRKEEELKFIVRNQKGKTRM